MEETELEAKAPSPGHPPGPLRPRSLCKAASDKRTASDEMATCTVSLTPEIPAPARAGGLGDVCFIGKSAGLLGSGGETSG